MKKFWILLTLALPVSALAAHDVRLPLDWVTLPEDADPNAPADKAVVGLYDTALVLERIFDLNAAVLDGLPEVSPESKEAARNHPRPKDWTPWHLEVFSTDLAVTGRGLIGVLTVKGTAAVQAFWRKQGVKPITKPAGLNDERDEFGTGAELALGTSDTPTEVAASIEPLIRAALAGGKIKDEKTFRASLVSTALDLHSIVQSLEANAGSQWWASGFRFELSVAASGKVSVFRSAGADVRFRLEWRRIMKAGKQAVSTPVMTSEVARFGENLKAFATALELDLEAISGNALEKKGFRAHTFRVGIGATASGSIGIGKDSASTFGHINFSRAAKKPVVYPHRKIAGEGSILLIQSRPSEKHLEFARANQIEVVEQVAYRVDRERMRKGLRKALRIGAFFAERGAVPQSKGWHIYEMKTGFDTSVVGDVGLAKLGGLAAFDIGFYNENF